MEAKPVRQFPDALDGIQIRTVGRKVVQPKVRCPARNSIDGKKDG
jgi:hypothetical protein